VFPCRERDSRLVHINVNVVKVMSIHSMTLLGSLMVRQWKRNTANISEVMEAGKFWRKRFFLLSDLNNSIHFMYVCVDILKQI